jgi:non-ribosomal peptide synthetase component E (peptide arylation enzyme)
MTESDTTADIVGYPQAFAARYRAAGMWPDRTIAQQFRATADAVPGRPALVTPDMTLTYAELDERTDRIAVGLRKVGLLPGERVLLQVNNDASAVLAWYGLLKAGLVPVATLAQHRSHELTAITELCAPAAHLVDSDYAAHDLIELAAQIAVGQPSLRLLLTTGPAGRGTSLANLEHSVRSDASAVRRLVDSYQQDIASDSMAVLQLSGGTTSTPKLIPRLRSPAACRSRTCSSRRRWPRSCYVGPN